jgi:hypothetical protein
MLPLRPGQIERRTHDYKRHGTAGLAAERLTALDQRVSQIASPLGKTDPGLLARMGPG